MNNTIQPNMFEMPFTRLAERQKRTRRQRQIDAAFERQHEDFKVAFKAFAKAYATANDRFLVADIVTAYNKEGLPKPVRDYRAIGGIIQKLVHDGFIHSVGTEKAADGSGRNMDVYSVK